jgi:hypothetical protein
LPADFADFLGRIHLDLRHLRHLREKSYPLISLIFRRSIQLNLRLSASSAGEKSPADLLAYLG